MPFWCRNRSLLICLKEPSKRDLWIKTFTGSRKSLIRPNRLSSPWYYISCFRGLRTCECLSLKCDWDRSRTWPILVWRAHSLVIQDLKLKAQWKMSFSDGMLFFFTYTRSFLILGENIPHKTSFLNTMFPSALMTKPSLTRVINTVGKSVQTKFKA